MPTYVMLAKYTDQGIKDIKNVSQRLEQRTKAREKMGVKALSLFAVMGEYDYVSILEAPNDEAIVTLNLELGSLGNVRTTTLRAFTQQEFTDMVKRIS